MTGADAASDVDGEDGVGGSVALAPGFWAKAAKGYSSFVQILGLSGFWTKMTFVKLRGTVSNL